MKLLFIFCALIVTLHADHVRWQGNFEKARQEALKENKAMMVFLITPECSMCMKMLRTTFMDQKYIAYINTHYVSVLVQKDQKMSYPIELLYTLEYPTLFFLDTNEIYTKKPLFGYVSPQSLAKHFP